MKEENFNYSQAYPYLLCTPLDVLMQYGVQESRPMYIGPRP